MTAVKFCGMTRPEDAAYASSLGAGFAGVIFAGGPRQLTVERAQTVFSALSGDVKRVGVFGNQAPADIAQIADALDLDVVQLHSNQEVDGVRTLRKRFSGKLWSVLRLAGSSLSSVMDAVIDESDAALFDKAVAGSLGGTGQSLDWAAIAPQMTEFRARFAKPIILAGGLRPENVARAIELIQPDAVDVSSGVETSPGIKDHTRMLAFARATGLQAEAR